MSLKVGFGARRILRTIDTETDREFGPVGEADLSSRPELYVGAFDIVRRSMEANARRPRFQLLPFIGAPFTRKSGARWLWLATPAGAVLGMIAIPVLVHRVIEPRDPVESVQIAVPAHRVAPNPIPVPAAVETETPAVTPPPVIEPSRRVAFQAPPVKPFRTGIVLPQITLPQAVVEFPPPLNDKPLETARLEAPKITLPARPLVGQEVFQSRDAAQVGADAGAGTIKTGGFGDPRGVPSAPAAASDGRAVQRVGSFDAPVGRGVGESVSGNRTVVASAGFADYDVPVAAAPAARTAVPVLETPVEITFKPTPVYTAGARQKKIEGEVRFEVLFAATGQIHLLRLVRGLGFGLDENARAAASQIRFRPAIRNGAPVDTTGTVHIVFELF